MRRSQFHCWPFCIFGAQEKRLLSTGSDLCGHVKFEVEDRLRPVVYGRCEQYRKATGHIFVADTVGYVEFCDGLPQALADDEFIITMVTY